MLIARIFPKTLKSFFSKYVYEILAPLQENFGRFFCGLCKGQLNPSESQARKALCYAKTKKVNTFKLVLIIVIGFYNKIWKFENKDQSLTPPPPYTHTHSL